MNEIDKIDIDLLLDSVVSATPEVPSSNAATTVIHSIARGISYFGWRDLFFDLRLPAGVAEKLIPIFMDAGYKLAEQRVRPKLGRAARTYTLAQDTANGVKVALLHLRAEILNDPDVVEMVQGSIQLINEDYARMLAQGCDKLEPTYNDYFMSLQAKRPNWQFVPWERVQGVIDRKLDLRDVFFTNAVPEIYVAPAKAQDSELTRADKVIIVNILSLSARSSGLAIDDWFIDLVNQAAFPDPIAQNIGPWRGKADVNARQLLNQASAIGAIPSPHDQEGDSALGLLLMPLLPGLGNPNRRNLAGIMLKAAMFTRQADIENIRNYTC